MKAKLFTMIVSLGLLAGCCTGYQGCGCSTYYTEPTCGDTNSCWDDACSGSRCVHVFDNIGTDGFPSACSTAIYTSGSYVDP